jgi:hypothetical protein
MTEGTFFHFSSYSFHVYFLYVSNDILPLHMKSISAFDHFLNRLAFRPSLFYNSKHGYHQAESIRPTPAVD